MKAILNLPKTNQYSKYNGWPLEVISVGNGKTNPIQLNINGRQWTDFKSSEVIICDLQKELQRAYDGKNWGETYATIEYHWLLEYMRINNIQMLFPPEYTEAQ